jgi:hypothetical protein
MNIIPFTGRLTLKDYRQIVALGYRPSKFGTIVRILASFFLTTGLVLLTIMSKFTVAYLVAFIILLCVTLIPYWIAYTRTSAYHNSPELQGEISGSATAQGITFESLNSTSEIPWGLYRNYQISETCVLLYQNKYFYNFFPRHFFKNQLDWVAFINLVKAKINDVS